MVFTLMPPVFYPGSCEVVLQLGFSGTHVFLVFLSQDVGADVAEVSCPSQGWWAVRRAVAGSPLFICSSLLSLDTEHRLA